MAQVSEAHVEEELARAQRELAEAWERQAATDEVLRVIASSPTDVQPVFDAIAATALRLCGATWSVNVEGGDQGLSAEAAVLELTPTPSKVPAPPIDATGAPNPWILSRLSRSAPMSVPRLPLTYASGAAWRRDSNKATTAAARDGTNTGSAMPTPGTG